eukprot:gene4046-8053_t
MSGIGDILEMHQTQIFAIFLTLADVLTSSLECNLSSDAAYELGWDRMRVPIKSFRNFSDLYFALEILAIFITFRWRAATHVGYLIDGVISGVQLWGESKFGRVTRLLSFFRLWRLIRLMSAMVGVERDAKDDVAQKLEQQERLVMSLQGEIIGLKDDRRKDSMTKESLERTLLKYKEEVDTLNEALTIAAMDIAEVAQADDDDDLDDNDFDDNSEVNGDDSDAGSSEKPQSHAHHGHAIADMDSTTGLEGKPFYDDYDDNEYVDAASTSLSDRKTQKSSNNISNASSSNRGRDALYKESRKDSNLDPYGKSKTTTYIVHKDGSFSQR